MTIPPSSSSSKILKNPSICIRVKEEILDSELSMTILLPQLIMDSSDPFLFFSFWQYSQQMVVT